MPEGKTENDGKSILMKTNSQQRSNSSKFLLGSAAQCVHGEGGLGRSLTLDRFGMLLDLTMGSATDHIPHYDLPRGIS